MEQEQMDKRNASGNKKHGSEEAVLGRARWSPKPQQLQLLEFLFDNGVVNPHKEEATYIRNVLREYGFVGETSVFYWFQNRRCRTRRKQRLEQQTAARQIAEANHMAVTQIEADSSHAFEAPPPSSSHFVFPPPPPDFCSYRSMAERGNRNLFIPPPPPPDAFWSYRSMTDEGNCDLVVPPSPAAFGTYGSMVDQGNWNLVAPSPPSPPVFSCYEAMADQGNWNLVAPPPPSPCVFSSYEAMAIQGNCNLVAPPSHPPPAAFSSHDAMADQDNYLVTRPPSYQKNMSSADKLMGVTEAPSPSSSPPTLGN